MKKILMLCLVVAALVACNSGSSKEDKTGKSTKDITQDPDYQEGLALVAKHKCMTCHAVDATITGPSYREVANKYAGSPDTIISHLAGKIINGGSGVWGQIFMTPHPDVTREEAESMVRYVLLLKK